MELKLNEQQNDAVTTQAQHSLVNAGAGTGKTQVIAHRIAHLIENGIACANSIIAITFTNKAAAEMRERVYHILKGKIIEAEVKAMQVSTFHSACLKILRAHAGSLGYDADFSVYGETESKEAVKSLSIKKIPAKDVKEILHFISGCKSNPDTLAFYKSVAYGNISGADNHNISKKWDMYLKYEESLKENNAMDFDDLLLNTDKLFLDNPDVLEYYSQKFEHIVIDEYQDTNKIQDSIVIQLCEQGSSLFAVGDGDQSIYKFRGAHVENMDNLSNKLSNLGGLEIFKLEINYRSTEQILHLANKLILNNRRIKILEKTLRTPNENRSGGLPAYFMDFMNPTEEAEYVIAKILELKHSQNNGASRYSDFAILYRTNRQADVFEKELIKNSIPYQIVGGTGLFERAISLDVLAFLGIAINPRDDTNILRIINKPSKGIGKMSISKMKEFQAERKISLWEVLQQADKVGVSKKVASGMKKLMDIAEKVSLGEYTPIEAINFWLEESGYLAKLHKDAREADDETATKSLSIISDLRSVACEYRTLREFLDMASLTSEATTNTDKIESEGNVYLMTAHASKGSEYATVFLTGMEDGLFPWGQDIEPDELEEERRLAYVGITRAKKRLYATSVLNRWEQYRVPSQFLKESGIR